MTFFEYRCHKCGLEITEDCPGGLAPDFIEQRCEVCEEYRKFFRFYTFGVGRGTSGATPPRSS